MRLSCNFVNVYTISYRIQHTCTRVHVRIPNGHPRDDPRAEVGEDVRVVVGVRVGPMEFQLYCFIIILVASVSADSLPDCHA